MSVGSAQRDGRDRPGGGDASLNFGFLAPIAPGLAALGAKAERYFDDPDTCVFHLRKLAEHLVRDTLVRRNERVYDEESFLEQTKRLEWSGFVDDHTAARLHRIRMLGNRGVHEVGLQPSQAAQQLRDARQVAVWFAAKFGDPDVVAPRFRVPQTRSGPSADELVAEQRVAEQAEHARTEAELEALRRHLEQPQVAFHPTLQRALGALPAADQRALEPALEAFREAPSDALSASHPFDDAEDDKLRAVPLPGGRVLVVVRGARGDVVIAVWIGPPDDAATWVRTRRFEVHPKLGALQVFDRDDVARHTPTPRGDARLFAAVTDDELVAFGLPVLLLPSVRALATDDELDALAPHLPDEASDALYLLAAGATVAETATELARSAPKEPVAPDDLAAAVHHPEAQRRFRVVEEHERLADALTGSLEAWRVFLHPDQRKLVRMRANGPVRVLGGAGTGKTVALLHRARHLARDVFTAPGDRLLVTTFTRNLAVELRRALGTLLTPDELARVDVANLHQWVHTFLAGHGQAHPTATFEQRRAAWARALDHEQLGLPAAFYRDEWDHVAQPHDVADEDAYLAADRRGRGTGLSRREKRRVWPVLAAYRAALDAAGVVEHADAVRTARALLARGDVAPSYVAVLADEVQDLSANELRLLRALAPPGPDDLFLVGDAHQRIYGHVASLGACGIEARGGRARRLRVNYRTTERIRGLAVATLAGEDIDDLDGGRDTLRGYRSLRLGVPPRVATLPSRDAEDRAVIDAITAWASECPDEHICLAARTLALRDRWAATLRAAGFPVATIEADEPTGPGVRVATMHRLKGLEFPRVLLASVQADTLPQPRRDLADADDTARANHVRSERCLLYVAATRARDHLVITGHGAPSSLLR